MVSTESLAFCGVAFLLSGTIRFIVETANQDGMTESTSVAQYSIRAIVGFLTHNLGSFGKGTFKWRTKRED